MSATKKSKTPAIKAKAKAKPKVKETADSGQSLVIVESPTKEKTLMRFLGKGYVVKSSFGHLRDLPKKKFGLDVDDHFKPQYEVLPQGKKIVPALKSASKSCSRVYLATDYDREGESIAWHLAELLEVPKDKLYRITFHEITPEAILEALKEPRKIDQHLVDAQMARRALDRIVGYRLSPLLWEKIKRGLSAGRVQSVAVKLICEREEEIEKFKSQEYWSVQVELENTKDKNRFPFTAQLGEWNGQKIQKLDIKSEPEAKAIATGLESSDYRVLAVTAKEKKRSPLPPFMTSTLAQESSRKLGFSAQRTMRVAQTLYEGVEIKGEQIGLITYMRTDSLNIAVSAQKEARDYISKKFGAAGLPEKPRVYKTKSKSAQEAHEAIRPTSILRDPESIKDSLNADQLKVYTLIWKRFVASQMADALYDTVSVEIEAKSGGSQGLLRAFGSTLRDPGFLKVYEDENESEEHADNEAQPAHNRIPLLSVEEALKFLKVNPEQHFTEPPPRYNEASLIKVLEQNGIGRPSTYAPIIDTILSRGYARQQDKRFYPTELGQIVNQQLRKHFPEIVDTQFTAKLEEKLDQIAEGELVWNEVVGEFYKPFSKSLGLAEKEMEKVSVQPKDSGELCTLCQGRLLIRESRFGKYLCCEHFPKCRYKVSLDADGKKIVPQSTDEKCQKCGSPMVVKMGRRGKFLACSGYPNCKNIIGLDREGNKVFRPDPKKTDRKCEKCNSMMFLRVGKRGPFLACSGFPKCRNIKKAENYNVLEEPEAGTSAPPQTP
jgi:DNA topoisomerase-1